ncbi:MAG: hypothetical protein ABL961_05905 [Vicinamibacterales bacterium]
MPTIIERSLQSLNDRLVLLAPHTRLVPPTFKNVEEGLSERHHRIRTIQQLRGRVYSADGAIRPQELSSDGRHEVPEDENSWHLMLLNPRGGITACAWYLQHGSDVSLESLRARNCPAALRRDTKESFEVAVRSEIQRARRSGLAYAEVGGWAVAEASRSGADALLLALAAYSLSRTLGGALGLTTATNRHASSSILRRLGGSALMAGDQAISPYYDPKYQCEMELLRFDSRAPSRRYAGLIAQLTEQMSAVQVCGRAAEEIYEPPVAAQSGFVGQIAAA